MDHHDGDSTGIYGFLAEFEACHDELNLFTAEILMDQAPSEEVELLSQILLTRQGDQYELLSKHQFHHNLDLSQGGHGAADIYVSLVIGPKFCSVEAGVEVDLEQDLGTIPAGTRTPYHWLREGIPFDEAFTVFREQKRAIAQLKDPFTTAP